MTANPLKWPGFEQLGRDFCDSIRPALEQLSAGETTFDDEATAGLSRLERWLNSPCVATVKLDGTNVGVDNTGLIVGRNQVVAPGASYQRVDVWTLLKEYQSKAEAFRKELETVGNEGITQAMLYGELVINGKYDYGKTGIFKGWLCFGAVLLASADDENASGRLTARLRAEGFNASRSGENRVLVTPSAKLETLLEDLDVRCVSKGYRPDCLAEELWADHDGVGELPYFRSMRRLIDSEWAQRLLLPADGPPLGEGFVVCSEADGRLFKWKHAGEELGKVPDQLGQVVQQLRALDDKIKLLPADVLPAFERLLQVATTKPTEVVVNAAPSKTSKEEDTAALAVWHSTLTKFEALEEVFERGGKAMASLQQEMIEQMWQDLVKDYGVKEKEAKQRATKVVRSETGKTFGAWKQGKACTKA
eukprot:TRINITY_DN1639_c0_g1_i2.p1 TRINITY_DN1639_c0_g1~~TRINITY_DN1639_c0_g1_i2.p1  ORF type:complete len:420 (-),score=110.19 TRINITY_DN1639_c0_g1_i2:155-1414(-)